MEESTRGIASYIVRDSFDDSADSISRVNHMNCIVECNCTKNAMLRGSSGDDVVSETPDFQFND